MQDQQLLEHITLYPQVMVGKPVIKGTRLTVAYILNLLAHGATSAEILAEYDGLSQEDMQGCLLFAAHTLENITLSRSSQRVGPEPNPDGLADGARV